MKHISKKLKKFLFSLAITLFIAHNAIAAVGCDLNDPDRDVKRFYPESTSYKTSYLSVDKIGGEELLKEIEKKLGDNFTGIFETIDVPYTFYTIFKDKEIIGYIHGANQKSTYGGMQVFLTFDKDKNIRNFYFQKLTSKAAKELRSKEFGQQFIGMNLNDFNQYDIQTKKAEENSKISKIKNPTTNAEDDFYNTLRGAKKNLILIDLFVKQNNEGEI